MKRVKDMVKYEITGNYLSNKCPEWMILTL